MPNTAMTSHAVELIDALKEMASGKTDAARLGEIAAMATGMDDGQFVEACSVRGMVAALRGDTFEVERLFNAALQHGGNDAWTLGNYATALNILAVGLHGRRCEMSCRPTRDGQEHRPQFFDAMPGYFYTLLHRPDGSYAMPLACDAIRELYGLGPEVTTNDYSALLALVHPDDAASRQRKLDESELDLSPFHAEYRIVLPKIGERWIEVHALPKRTGDGGTRWDGFINDITERKRMESELRLKEYVLDQARIGVYLSDEQARLIYVNDEACRALGYRREELLTKTTMDIDASHSINQTMDVRRKTLDDGAFTFETMHVRSDGSLLPVEVLASSVEYQDRTIGVALAVDITERKCMAAALVARERDFHSLAENMPDNVARWDTEGRLLYSNPTHQRTLGKSFDEILGKTHEEIFPDRRLASFDDEFARVVATGNEARIPRVQVPTLDGGVAIHDVRLTPEFDAKGRVVSVLGLGRDMTDIYLMQDEIAAREREFRRQARFQQSLLSGMRNAGIILVVVENGHFVYTNDHYVGCQLGYAEGQLPDTVSFIELIHPDDRPRIVEMHRDRLAGKPMPISYEIGALGGDGSRREYEFHVTQIPDIAPPQTLLLALDIAERKETEQALEDSRTQLRGLIAQREEAREEERRYIAREIHDNLGQILSGLRLNVSRFARRHAANSAEMREHLRGMGELVDLAVQEVRNISSALRPVELDIDIRAALSSHLERFGAYTGIACELNAEADVGLTEEAHKLALYRIAQESLTNIARHAQASRVEIGLRVESPYCVLSICDNGIGFDTGASKPKSFGLVGMRERVAMLGGSVVIDSSPGKGTEIVVRIPVQKIT